ncbi:hypothetical protein BN2475_110062 [Paraburkholderia ribeironis]|uniref:Uncharacterized protein n=1 Tax=Paraburkholderia ribeironis TaxID=1247936 RepID=A0A1N7RQF9_9BURK|nr:hypothetical protein BN2475_110062 [Paraburkholderia ribeironis]
MFRKQRIYRRQHLTRLTGHILSDVFGHLTCKIDCSLMDRDLRQTLAYMATLDFRHLHSSGVTLAMENQRSGPASAA